MKDKKHIRRIVRSKVLAMSAEERSSASGVIFARLASSDVFRLSGTVALYVSLPDEPQTEHFLNEFCHCKRLVIPRVSGAEMEFYEYSPERLVRGAFGIWEPSSGSARCPVEDIDLIVVPGVSFTRRGERLGRGGGYYDRYLSRSGFRARSVGVCFETQISDSLPTEPYDRPVDAVITEKCE